MISSSTAEPYLSIRTIDIIIQILTLGTRSFQQAGLASQTYSMNVLERHTYINRQKANMLEFTALGTFIVFDRYHSTSVGSSLSRTYSFVAIGGISLFLYIHLGTPLYK